MKITKLLTDQAILTELGVRLTAVRLERNLQQAELADRAGVSTRTVERIEAGNSAQISSFIRLCRALDLIEHFDLLIAEPSPSPIQQLKLLGKKRRRASSAKTASPTSSEWSWGTEK